MVILSESYLQNLEHKAISEVFHITPKTFRRYEDHMSCVFLVQTRSWWLFTFLNKQDPAVQCTIEYEDRNKS